MMAATCIGVFLLAIVLEFVRRLSKEYDQFILRQFQQHVNAQAAISEVKNDYCAEGPQPSSHTATFRATPVQQLVRSLIRKLFPNFSSS
jgi:copper transporter 1